MELVYVPTRIRSVSKAKVCEVQTQFPTLPLSSWMSASFNLGGHFFLGGKGIQEFEKFSQVLGSWWAKYKVLDPELPFFHQFGEEEYGFGLPMATHGDEGRGRYKRPIMIFSFQPILTNFNGEVNLKGWGCCQMVFG